MSVELQPPPWFGRRDVVLLAVVLLWWAWVLLSQLWSGMAALTTAYLVTPLVLLAGVALGTFLGRVDDRWPVPELVAVFALIVLIGPQIYANAQGAVGVQLVGLAALLLMGRVSVRTSPERAGWTFAVVTLVVVLAMLLAARSDAAAILAVPLAFGSALVLVSRWGPRRRTTMVVCVAVLAWAAVIVVWLGRRATWPDWLSATSALSDARRVLWGDALDLWREHPLVGGGVGSFTPFSELASSSVHLERAHSVVLQVGSELGLVGVLLFSAVVVGGLLVALGGSRQAGVIAAAAWTCLGIHATIDHLWEFPVVALTAGVVLGFSRSAGCAPAEQDPRPV